MSIYGGKRSIWVTNCNSFPGNEPPFGKVLAYDSRIELVYVNGTPGEDPFVTAGLMQRIRSFGLLAGCWFVPRGAPASIEAIRASVMVTDLNPDAVLLDIETHDLAFQRAFVAEYRRLKPGRATDVTFEPRQDSSTVAWFEYQQARMHVFPQLYDFKMRPADPRHELGVWGGIVGWDNVHLALNAAQDWWALDDGLLFAADTLPDKRPALQRFLAGRRPTGWTTRRAHDKLAASLPTLEPCGEELKEAA